MLPSCSQIEVAMHIWKDTNLLLFDFSLHRTSGVWIETLCHSYFLQILSANRMSGHPNFSYSDFNFWFLPFISYDSESILFLKGIPQKSKRSQLVETFNRIWSLRVYAIVETKHLLAWYKLLALWLPMNNQCA